MDRGVAHVAFAIDAGYLPWCGVAVRSLMDHVDGSLVVHVLHDGSLAGSVADPLRRLTAEGGAALELHAVEDRRLEQLPSVDRFGAVVWLRFLLPELLPDLDRILYLDADTLVAAPIASLLATDLADRPLGAVTNVVEPALWPHLHELGLEEPRDFLNSGVLLLDLARLRDEDGVAHLLATVHELGDRLLWPDQDTLNVAFRDRWHHLDPRWNAQYSFWEWRPLALGVIPEGDLDRATSDPGIVHFEGPSLCKPWHALCRHPWRNAYWRTLDRTPWAGARPEDLTMATRLIRLLPAERQLPAYQQLARVRRRARRQVRA